MAKRFSFPLEAVLKVRKQQQDEKKRSVAERLREMSKLQSHLMSRNEQIASEIRKTRDNAVHAHLDVSEMSRRRFWISHLQRGLLETEFQIRTLEQQLDKDRQVLAEATKECKVVEKLKERRFEEYSKEMQRQETLEADELAINRYLQQRREGAK